MSSNDQEGSSDDRKVAFFDRDVAEELLDLVDDRPGEADEDLLDDAVASLAAANGGLPAKDQQAVASGEGVALGLGPDDVDSLTTLIESNTDKDRTTLRSIGRTLKSKLRAAAKKNRSGAGS